MIPKTWIGLAAVAVTLGAAPAFAQAQRYTITDLGSLYGCCTSEDESYATGINNAGDVVGSALTPAGVYHPVPFIYRNGRMVAITSTLGYATAINNAGHVTGYIQRTGNVNMEAFLYDDSLHHLGGLPLHSRDGYAVAWALNNTDVIVGESGGMSRGALAGAMVWVAGQMFSSAYRDARIAYGVNDSGAIIGLRSTDSGSVNHAFLLDRNGFKDLGTLDGDPAGVSVPFAINAGGVVVGYSTIASNSTQRAFAYSSGIMRDLGVLTGVAGFPAGWEYSVAFAINTPGDIVGESSGAAFLYHAGTMEDLNAAIDHDENGWPRIHTATGINDRGQIVGNAYFGDRPGLHAFQLTPTERPQP
jgi:probable HAF family extracellular repeat protein